MIVKRPWIVTPQAEGYRRRACATKSGARRVAERLAAKLGRRVNIRCISLGTYNVEQVPYIAQRDIPSARPWVLDLGVPEGEESKRNPRWRHFKSYGSCCEVGQRLAAKRGRPVAFWHEADERVFYVDASDKVITSYPDPHSVASLLRG